MGIRYLASLDPPVWQALRSEAIFPVTDRDDLVYGAYQPDETNTGLLTPESSLTDYNSPAVNSVTIPDGAVIENKIIYGDVTFAGDATLRNCLLVGGANVITSGNTGVLRCINTRTGIAKLYDCRIRPRQESDGRDCALGWQYELYRCHLTGGVDGCGIYKTSSPYECHVKVKGCLIEDLVYIYPDRDHSDGTHNDCIQHQGGTHAEVVGNTLRGTAHLIAGLDINDVPSSIRWQFTDPNRPTRPAYLTGSTPFGWAPGSCLIIQKNISGAPGFDSTTKTNDNWHEWGKAQLLIKSTADDFECKRNRFSKLRPAASNSSPPPSYSSYTIRFDSIAASNNVDGLTSSGSVANTTNVWSDGPDAGEALTTPRANGIHSDT